MHVSHFKKKNNLHSSIVSVSPDRSCGLRPRKSNRRITIWVVFLSYFSIPNKSRPLFFICLFVESSVAEVWSKWFLDFCRNSVRSPVLKSSQPSDKSKKGQTFSVYQLMKAIYICVIVCRLVHITEVNSKQII